LKETIYTIPINDAFGKDTECPLCEFIKNEEKDRIEYALGASMMEPDARILSNEKGYCQRHTSMMYSFGNKLSHALVLETRLKYISDEIENLKYQFKPQKKGFLKKHKGEFIKPVLSSHSCVVCDRLEYVFSAFMKNLFYMYKTDNEFKEKFFSSKGFCLSHFDDLICYGNKYLPQDDFNDFVIRLCDIQKSNIDRVYEDVKWFTKKFDYRYKDEDWKNSKDAVPRACTKISGYLDEE
jgi:hypothetical protein